jgi:hypothetical protein
MSNKENNQEFLSLVQGQHFDKKNKKNKDRNNKNKKNNTNNVKEGFTGNQNENGLGQDIDLAPNYKPVLINEYTRMKTTSAQNQKDLTELQNLQSQYNNLLSKYKDLTNQIKTDTKNNMEKISLSNPYLEKNITLSNTNGALPIISSGTGGYVTSQGIFKNYPDIATANATSGQNGCPADFTKNVQLDKYSALLTQGSDMVSGQSCGNENRNVYVSSMIKNPKATYVGCYADNTTGTPTMTFIGGAPSPPNSAAIVNGNFNEPQIPANTYTGYWGSTAVPGWYFNAMLVNSFINSSYPIPYPNGNQCVSIYYNQYIYQDINLVAGTYTLSFMACGSNIGGAGNPINIVVASTNPTPTQATQTFNVQPPVNVWTSYSETFNITTSGIFQITFSGLTNGLYSALTSVSLSPNSTPSSPGTYTYSACEDAAINGGYKYFALQNVNPSNSQGYCAVSNDGIASTVNGTANIASKQIVLWSSNTGGQPGSYASFNNGSLSVLNSSGAAIFSTPNTTKQPSNYIGCYADQSTRAMPLYNNGSQQYNNSECQQIAQSQGATYYGLQNSTSGQNAQCALSSNLGQAQEYGVANNCTQISDGSWSGGGWSNAVYSTTTPTSNYFLILQSDGNMCIYLGSNPNDNQGGVWCTMTNGKQQQGNPLMVSANNKFGQNWMPSGSVLYPGEYLSFTNGNLVLIMQSDGNLVLYTYQLSTNCQKMADGKMGGGLGANALYELNEVGYPNNLGNVAYVDSNAVLHQYPSSMIGYSNEYNMYENFNSTGNDLSQVQVTDINACKQQCNSYDGNQCGGFVYEKASNICNLKGSGIYPKSPRQYTSAYTLAVRKPTIINNSSNTDPNINPNIASFFDSKMVQIDSVQYQNYPQGDAMTPDSFNEYSNPAISENIKNQMTQLQNQLTTVASHIANKMEEMYNEDKGVVSKMNMNDEQFKKQILMYKTVSMREQGINQGPNSVNNVKVKEGMQNMSINDINGLLQDTDLHVLQENYGYMFWSILAVGLLTVTVNVMRRE